MKFEWADMPWYIDDREICVVPNKNFLLVLTKELPVIYPFSKKKVQNQQIIVRKSITELCRNSKIFTAISTGP